MSNRRLILLVFAMVALGALVWLDRTGESEGDGVAAVRRPPPATVVAGGDPTRTSTPAESVPVESSRNVEPSRAVDLAGPAATGERPKARRERSDADADGAVDMGRGSADGAARRSTAGSEPKSAVGRDGTRGATGPVEADSDDDRDPNREARLAAEDSRAAAAPGARGQAGGEQAADDGDGPGAFPDDDQGEKPAEAEPAAVASRSPARQPRGDVAARRPRDAVAPRRPRDAVAARRPRGDGTSTNPWGNIPLDKLGATVERPLFEPSRRAWQPPPPPPVVERVKPPERVAPPPDPSMLVLMGVTAGSGRAIAIVQNNSTNRVQRVEEGEYIDGWEVRSVSSREVVISKEGVTAKLQLNTPPRL